MAKEKKPKDADAPAETEKKDTAPAIAETAAPIADAPKVGASPLNGSN